MFGVGPQAQWNHGAQIVSGILQEGVQKVARRTERQEERHNRQRQPEVELAEDLHALADARHDRDGSDAGNDGNQDDHRRDVGALLASVVDVDEKAGASELVETRGHLLHAKPERRRHAEYRAENGEDVGGVPPRPVDPVADQRIERRADGERQLLAIGEIGQRQTNHHIDGPGMQAPVEEGDAHRHLRRLRRLRVDAGALADEGIALEMVDRLGDRPEHQADAHARAEQHGEPGEVAELGAVVVVAEAYIAVPADQQPKDEKQEHGDDAQVVPLQHHHHPILDGREGLAGRLRPDCAEDDERKDDEPSTRWPWPG